MEICGECPVTSLVLKVKPITSTCVKISNMSVVLLYLSLWKSVKSSLCDFNMKKLFKVKLKELSDCDGNTF